MLDNNKRASILLLSSVFLLISTIIFLVWSTIVKFSGIFPFLITLILGATTIYCVLFSIWDSHSSARRNFPEYRRLITTNKFNTNYDYDFIFAYRCDKILHLLNSPSFNQIDIDDFISHFTDKSGSIKLKRWGPVTLIALVMFPLWSEFVGKNMGPGWDLIMLILMSIFISMLIILANNLLRETLLSKANKYDELVNILLLVKSLKNNT